MKFQLNIDERDALVDLLKSEGWKPLLKCLAEIVARHEQSLLKYDLSEGADKLIQQKARIEGAYRLQSDFTEIKKHFVKQGE